MNFLQGGVECPCATFCCSATASRWRTFVFALSNVSAASSCNCCDSDASCIPTTNRSRIISSFSASFSQFSAKRYSSRIYCSAISPSCWLRRLNLAHSKITLRQTLKNVSNFRITISYLFRSSSVAFVESNTESASSPKQYSRVLTCCGSPTILQ